MTITSLHLVSPHLDSSRKFTSRSAAFCGSNVYSAETPSKAIMENIYLKNHVLRRESNMMPYIKSWKDSIVESILHKLTSIGKNILKFPTLFSSKMDNSLSVTVVDNEGLIAPELFGNSLGKTEQFICDRAHVCNPAKKKFSVMTEKKQYDAIFEVEKSDIISTYNSILTNYLKTYPYYDYDIANILDNEDVENFPRDNMHSDVICKNNSVMESQSSPHVGDTETSNNITNHPCAMQIDLQTCTNSDTDTINNKNDSVSNTDVEDASIDTKSFLIIHDSDIPPKYGDSVKESTLSTCSTDMCRKSGDDIANRFYGKIEDSTCDLEVSTKKPLLKQRKKVNIVAIGRGRGRARSQLRRSGVSQSRHRKKRTKHNIIMNIQDDYEVWQDFGIYDSIQTDRSYNTDDCLDSCSNLEDIDEYDISDANKFIKETMIDLMICDFSDKTLGKGKPKTCDNNVKQKTTEYSTKVPYVPDPSMNIDDYYEDDNDEKSDLQKSSSRSRLISESSTDSEDSIVFEIGSDANSTTDVDYDEPSSEDEKESKDDAKLTQKVRFNLIPIVRTMFQWDYAYRAARKGPWEQIARDRERFRGRINYIAASLNPILTNQHRDHIWQQRFALLQ